MSAQKITEEGGNVPSDAAEEMPEAGGRLAPDDVKALAEFFEIFLRWDDERAQRQGEQPASKDLAASEPVKRVRSGQ